MLKLLSSFNATIKIVPKGSNLLILCFTGILLFCLGSGFFFILKRVDYWPPLIAAGVILIVIIFVWCLSRREIDENLIPPINISRSSGTDSTAISMPHRVITDLENVAILERICSAILHRSPLPEPDGLVDEGGNPIPESKDRATEIIQAVNNQVNETIDAIQSYANISRDQGENAQEKIDYEPNIEDVKHVNRTVDQLC